MDVVVVVPAISVSRPSGETLNGGPGGDDDDLLRGGPHTDILEGGEGEDDLAGGDQIDLSAFDNENGTALFSSSPPDATTGDDN